MPFPMRDMRPHVTHELNPVDATDPYGQRSRKFKDDLVKPIEPIDPEPLDLPIVERVTFDVDGDRFEDRFDRLHRHSSDSHPQAFGATKTRFDLDDDLNQIPGSKRKLRDDVFELDLDDDL